MDPIALIGAGPLGLEMAIALKRAGLTYVHLEAGQIGSTIQWWPHDTRWFSSNERISIAGVPLVTPAQEKATREQYLAYLRAVALQFELEIQTFTRVTRIERNAEGTFTLTTQTVHSAAGEAFTTETRRHGGVEKQWIASKVILAIGGTARPNLLNVPGEELPHVSHFLHDPHTYFRKDLLVVGGRNSAVESALRCHQAGARVAFSYRGPHLDKERIKYWLYPEMSGLLKAGRIVPLFETNVRAITPAHGVLARADGSTFQQPADFVLLHTGYDADMSLAQAAGIELRGPPQEPAYDPRTMETNVPGVYIAGTAIAGTQQRYRVFLENCHIHVERIVNHLRGLPPPAEPNLPASPES